MLHRAFLIVLLLCWSTAGSAADLIDASGRTVQVPDHVRRVLPAGPPAALLLEAVAPDLMIGWPSPVSQQARALVSSQASNLPEIPRLTGREDVTDKIAALKPDLIVDYGTISPRFRELARATQQRTGVPTILLDGSLDDIPTVFLTLGRLLHRQARAEVLARFARALLALPISPHGHPTVLCARGPDGLTIDAPGTDLTEVFGRLGWRVVAPAGMGPFRRVDFAAIRTLDPDILVFSDPASKELLARSAAWRSLRAVRDGHAMVAPRLPFGWIDEPPSINRLLGMAWLGGRDPATLAATFNAVVYGRVLTSMELQSLLAGVHALTW